jgi:hypothetical protein
MQVYLGEQYVNCPTLSDVSFVVEGRRFYAHRIALLASSDAFRAMFDGGYRVSSEVSQLMQFLYLGVSTPRCALGKSLINGSSHTHSGSFSRSKHCAATSMTVSIGWRNRSAL